MKKTLKIFLIITIILLTCSCSKRASTSKQISSVLSKNGFIIRDETSLIEDKEIEKIYIVTNNKYQFEYQVYKDEKTTKQKYDSNVQELKKNTYKTDSEKKKDNYGKYIQEQNDKYIVVIRNEKILLYVSINSSYKKEFNKVLKELGY